MASKTPEELAVDAADRITAAVKELDKSATKLAESHVTTSKHLDNLAKGLAETMMILNNTIIKALEDFGKMGNLLSGLNIEVGEPKEPQEEDEPQEEQSPEEVAEEDFEECTHTGPCDCEDVTVVEGEESPSDN